jgi:hypothetical protein
MLVAGDRELARVCSMNRKISIRATKGVVRGITPDAMREQSSRRRIEPIRSALPPGDVMMSANLRQRRVATSQSALAVE